MAIVTTVNPKIMDCFTAKLIGSSDVVLLTIIVDKAAEQGIDVTKEPVRLTRAELREEAQCCEVTLTSSLKKLVDCGLLTRTPDPAGRNKGYDYQLNMPLYITGLELE